jgi:mannosyltransferase OCH1-like enzyme
VKKTIWQYWEGDRTDFIDMCLETVEKNTKYFSRVLLNEKTVFKYLPDLRRDLDELPRIANKADYIRFRLLNEYGGVWLDADAVLLRDLREAWNLMLDEGHTFGASSHFGLGKPSIWFLMSERKSLITEKYIMLADRILDTVDKRKITWSQLGADLLWKFTNTENYHHFPVEKFCPVPYYEYNKYFQNIEPSVLIGDKSYTFIFFNEMLNRNQKIFLAKSREDILKDNNLISKIFKKYIN